MLPLLEICCICNIKVTFFNYDHHHHDHLHVKWVPCHHSIARPPVVEGEHDLQIWRVVVNILNKQLRTADKG
jgi:hypothetical protein